MQSTIFLDTTIQIERITATEVRKAEIAHALYDKRVITSTYVLGEYLRTLVKDAVYLYGLVSATEQMYEVEIQIAQIFSKRSASRCLLLWALLHQANAYERDIILYHLRMWLRHGLLNRFMMGIDEMIDTTCCGLAKERPVQAEEDFQLRAQCTRRVKECELVALLTKYPSELQTVAAEFANHTDRSLARMSELCTLLLNDPDVARGRNCTWYLGDLVIALEAPKDAAIYTSNIKHFAPICRLLGKQLYRA